MVGVIEGPLVHARGQDLQVDMPLACLQDPLIFDSSTDTPTDVVARAAWGEECVLYLLHKLLQMHRQLVGGLLWFSADGCIMLPLDLLQEPNV